MQTRSTLYKGTLKRHPDPESGEGEKQSGAPARRRSGEPDQLWSGLSVCKQMQICHKAVQNRDAGIKRDRKRTLRSLPSVRLTDRWGRQTPTGAVRTAPFLCVNIQINT